MSTESDDTRQPAPGVEVAPIRRRPGRRPRSSIPCHVPGCGEELINGRAFFKRRVKHDGKNNEGSGKRLEVGHRSHAHPTHYLAVFLLVHMQLQDLLCPLPSQQRSNGRPAHAILPAVRPLPVAG